jgi:hypothetical protein
MFEAFMSGAIDEAIEGVTVLARPALAAAAVDVLAADGYLLGTPANIGCMSGRSSTSSTRSTIRVWRRPGDDPTVWSWRCLRSIRCAAAADTHLCLLYVLPQGLAQGADGVAIDLGQQVVQARQVSRSG